MIYESRLELAMLMLADFAQSVRGIVAQPFEYQIRGGPPVSRLANVQFLAGYRRDWLFCPTLVDAAMGTGLDGVTLGGAVGY